MTSDELVTLIRNIGSVPDTGSTGSENADLLLHADEALRSYLLPRLINLSESYYTLRQRTTLTSAVKYRLPRRATYNQLADLWYVDGSDRIWLDKLDPADLDAYNGSGTGSPAGYFLEGNDIVLVPTDGSYSGALEFVFYGRPGSLVLTSAARQVTAVDTATRTLTLASTVPTTWTAANDFDIHSQYSGAELKMWDADATTVSGTSIVLSSSYPIDGSLFGTKAVEIGDWVVLAGKSALPALPEELHGLLARATALGLAESSGYAEKVQLHASVLEKYLKETTMAAETRIAARPMTVGGKGFLTRGSRGYFPRRLT